MTAIQLFFIKEKGRDTKMNKATKLTLAELLRRKEQMIASKKIKKTMDLYIKSIDSVITIEEPDGALCRDANDMEAGEGDKYMCYECIKEPDIKSKEVQDAFGCAVPMDIVEIIFAPGEIPQIAIECMKLAGYMGGVGSRKKLIQTDGDLQLIHFYLQKGFDWDRLARLSLSEKIFLKASMELAVEEETEKYKALLGSG